MNLTLSDWANIATIAGAIFAVVALAYTAIQVRHNTKASQGQFWLELRRMFAEHQWVHTKLRNFAWSNAGRISLTDYEWATIEAYMGLFEHCELMLQGGVIDRKTFNAIYGYRVNNLLNAPIIVRTKLIENRSGWQTFIKLLESMESALGRNRYLYGFWDNEEGKWKLWWGYVEKPKDSIYYNTYADLSVSFHSKFIELERREHGVARAWLMNENRIDLLINWSNPKNKRLDDEIAKLYPLS